MRYNKRPHQYTERQMARRIRRLWLKLWWHKGVDILLTHAPAYELGDDKDLCHRGFRCFRRFMEKYRPRIMAHGHVHQSYRYDFQQERTYMDTRVINACGHCYVDI